MRMGGTPFCYFFFVLQVFDAQPSVVFGLIQIEFFNFLPALNFTTFFSAILISLPVCGLWPVRAARVVTEKEPNPIKVTLSSFASALAIVSSVDFRAFSAVVLGISADEL